MGWAVYCALLAVTYTSAEGVGYPAVYYLAAFVCVNGPLACLSAWERSLAESGQELRAVRRRILTFRVVTSIGFVIYCTSPSFLYSPYGWFANDLIARAEGLAEVSYSVDESQSAAIPPSPQPIDGSAPALSPGPIPPAPLTAPTSHTTPGVMNTPAEFCTRDGEDRRRARTDDASIAQSCATAAAAGDPVAAYHLATLYAEGRGIRQDRAAANRWYQFAAERGVGEAEAFIGR